MKLRTKVEIEAGRQTRDVTRGIGAEIRRQREDAGIGQATLARRAGISPAYLSMIEAGTAMPALAVLARIAAALGGRLGVRLDPGTGPAIRDRIQARMVEAFLETLHPRWRRFLEVPVYRPVRGVIDAVLHDPDAPIALAIEFQSQIRRLEQQMRWSTEKAAALESAGSPALPGLLGNAPVSRLLVLRSTEGNRRLAREFELTLGASYPGRPPDLFRALTDTGLWPGPGLLWMRVEGTQARLLDRPPRGLGLGRDGR